MSHLSNGRVRFALAGIILTGAVAASVEGAVIATDSFNVRAGASSGVYYNSTFSSTGPLDGQNPSDSTGFSGGWDTTSSSTTDIRIAAVGMTSPFQTAASVPVSPATDGEASLLVNANNRGVARPLAALPVSASYYFSGLVSITGSSTSARVGLGSNISQAGTLATTGAGVFVNFSGSGMSLTAPDSTHSGAFASATFIDTGTNSAFSFASGTTYLFTVAIGELGSGGVDTVTANLFTTSSTPVATASLSNVSFSTAVDAGYLVLNKINTTNGAVRFDEFRLGTELADVAAIPEPASVGLFATVGGLVMARRRPRGA